MTVDRLTGGSGKADNCTVAASSSFPLFVLLAGANRIRRGAGTRVSSVVAGRMKKGDVSMSCRVVHSVVGTGSELSTNLTT